MDLIGQSRRQRAFSRAAFNPNKRTETIRSRICKGLDELLAAQMAVCRSTAECVIPGRRHRIGTKGSRSYSFHWMQNQMKDLG